MYGYMPAKTVIFNTRAVAIHSFALSPRNTILFSPHGRFVLVAGFGNLAGQMDIYDLEKDYRKVCTIEASNASVCKWSPDGKHILTATTSPRLRVDNGVRIWHVGGGLMYNEELQELYHVTWRPQSISVHPLEDPLHSIPTPHASALTYLGTVKTPSKPAGAYRPPGARGQVTPLAFKREDEGGVAYVSNGSLSLGTHINGFGKQRRREVPGAETVSHDKPSDAPQEVDGDLSKAALKNKKKRESKKAKDAADRTDNDAGVNAETNPSQNSDQRGQRPLQPPNQRRQPPPQHLQPQHQPKQKPRNTPSHPPGFPPNPAHSTRTNGTPTPAPVPVSPEPTVTSPGGPQDKKIRALLKKLRAIDELKMRRAGGEKLEGTQVKKMETEDGVRRELEGLGWRD